MAAHYLEFERPIGELETKIEELSRLSETAGPGAFDTEIDALRQRVADLRRQTYAHLDAWQKTQIARHPQRPHFVDYISGLIEEFVELRGDRKFATTRPSSAALAGSEASRWWWLARRRATTPTAA